VRVTVDNEKEKLEDLLNRVLTDYSDETITWNKFLGFFSKRGHYEGYKEIGISPTKKQKFI
jgi:hypothetical protein